MHYAKQTPFGQPRSQADHCCVEFRERVKARKILLASLHDSVWLALEHRQRKNDIESAIDRIWMSVKEQPIVAWAGMWTDSKEWGAVYSGLMTDCNEAIRPIHTRMPVLLHEEDHDRWLHGDLSDVIAFRDRCFPDELIEINRTDQPWNKRTVAVA